MGCKLKPLEQVKIPKRKEKWSEADLAKWIEKHPIGTKVRYWSIRSVDDSYVDTVIESVPWRLGHGQPVVLLEHVGRGGGVALDHLAKLPDDAGGAT